MKFGLIGYPLTHSYSADWFRGKLDYRLYEIETLDELPRVMAEVAGFNVTTPYKHQVISYLDGLSKVVLEVGAVNCVRCENGKWIGYNTDVEGVRVTLDAFSPNPKSALIFGNGGASKAVQFVLNERHIPYEIYTRNSPQPIDEVMVRNELIINATPVGMYPNTGASPMSEDACAALTAGHALLDLIYNPVETLFLKQGRERGAGTCNGMTMFNAQAEASWRLFREIL